MGLNYFWSRELGSQFADLSTGIAQGADGSIYITGTSYGNFEGVANQYTPSVNRNKGDIFCAKYSTTGSQQWVRLYGAGGYDYGNAITIDGNGNPLIGGYIEGSSYDATYFNVSPNAGDKFNSRYGAGFSVDTITDLDINNEGTLYYAGVTSSSKFNGQSNNDTSSNPYLVKTSETPKYNSNGNLQYYAEWTTFFNRGYGDYGFGSNISSIDVSDSGSTYVVTTGSTYGSYSYLHNIDPNGSISWSLNLGDTGGSGPTTTPLSVLANNVLSTADGGVYVAGTTSRGDYYGENPNYAPDSSYGFLSRLSEYGFHEWSVVIPNGGRSHSSLESIDELQNGNLLVSGKYFDTSGEYGYLAEIDPTGNILWSRQSSEELASIQDVIEGIDGFTYILGNTEDENVFLAKLNFDPNDIDLSESAFDENIADGSLVATLSTSDPDSGDTHTYALVSGVGSTDNSVFTIDGDQLKIKASPDYETQDSYSVRLQTEDSGGLTFDKAFTFTVNDLNETSNPGSTFAEYGQISINHNWQTINLDQTYTNAVIIASDPTLKGADPVAVRIRNVGTDSFQVRLQEPNYKDGAHTNETISYVVAEEGDWQLNDGTRLSVGTQTSNKLSSAGFETIDLESGFTGSPAVLTQTQTFNGGDWVTTRTKKIGTGSFQVTMQEEERLNGGGHAQETIGWIAVDSGDSNVGGTQISSGLTANIFTDKSKNHAFSNSFESAPTLLTKLATFDGADPANSRIQTVSNAGFRAMVQEETSSDSEVFHTSESLAFLALDGTSGTLEGTAYQPTQTIGEYGQISVNHQWTSIDLTNTYTSPIVITSDPTIKGGDPTVVRLRNIDSNSFDLRLQEPNYEDGSHTNEVISYVVLEEGTWDLTDGTQIAAGSKDTDKLSTRGREKISFDDTFINGPAVLTQIQTFNGSDWVTTRTDAISGESFKVTMQEEERINASGHKYETIGWVAIDQGVATDGDTIIEGGMTPDVFTEATKTYTFDGSFDSAPTLLTKLSTFDGADPANSRIKSVSNTGFSAMVQEEQSRDTETGHTTESISFLAFNGSSGTIEAVI